MRGTAAWKGRAVAVKRKAESKCELCLKFKHSFRLALGTYRPIRAELAYANNSHSAECHCSLVTR